MNVYCKIISFLLCLPFLSTSYGYKTVRELGDIVQLGLPAAALSSTYFMDDYDGFKSFMKSYMVTIAATHVLKDITHKQRPDGSDYRSFPSGHTSSAFAGASFIHFRYGLKYSFPLYALATFTGYSRVQSKKHYIEDVIAGAGLAILSSWYFTKPYSDKHSFSMRYDTNKKMFSLTIVKLF
tara:strand:- start:193 stop:735 length:543 start_codon:yes stop_codon:yes gene_type:complete